MTKRVPRRARPAVGHWDGDEMELVGRYSYRPEFQPLLFEYIGAVPGQRVLDVGSGSGYLARLIASAHPSSHVTCVDADPAMLVVARRIVAGSALFDRMSVVDGDAYDLPFADGSFDLVTSHLLMCILNDPGRALREQMRVARAGGTVSCVVCFCRTDRLPHYHGRTGLPGDHRIDALRHGLARAWRRTVRPRLLDLDHTVVNQDIVWHFRQAGLLDVRVNGHLAVVAPGDDRIAPDEGVDFSIAMHEAELARLRDQRRRYGAELAAGGFSTAEFDELLEYETARLGRLREHPNAVKETMEVYTEPMLIVRGTVPGTAA
ncbi:MAG: class I SAM-dependent methyltransferase [Deinococcales bacterium]